MYTAGEVPIPGVDTDWLVAKIRHAGSDVTFVKDMDDLVPAITAQMLPDDTVIFFGGDDLFRLADRITQSMR
jgi:UDP-N-acetylmuramate-alanine ligase